MYDMIIVGAGVAGMNAALYALRNGKSVLIIESGAVGGQIAESPKVENFPGIVEISGSELADNIFRQITQKGAEIEYDRVINIEKKDGIFTVFTEYSSFKCKCVIAAAGVDHKHIGVPGEKELLGRGVYYCALCDGPFYKGKEVALIGDGNTAMQYAVVLSNICSKVSLLTWTDKFFGDKMLEKSMRAKSGIEYLPETAVTAFSGDGKLSAVEYTDKKTGEKRSLPVSAVFVAIGQVADNAVFNKFCDLDEYGFILTDADMRCREAGFFAAGDCRRKNVRQIATAVSDGAVAAVSACAYLDSLT